MTGQWREEYDIGCTYRIHVDGRVAAYGPELDGPRPNLWRASGWSSDPRINSDAEHRHLCVDATQAQLLAALRDWAEETQQQTPDQQARSVSQKCWNTTCIATDCDGGNHLDVIGTTWRQKRGEEFCASCDRWHVLGTCTWSALLGQPVSLAEQGIVVPEEKP